MSNTFTAVPAAPTPLLVDVKQASRTLGISSRLLWSLTNGGELPHVRIGRRVLYSPADLAGWIERKKVGGDDRARSTV